MERFTKYLLFKREKKCFRFQSIFRDSSNNQSVLLALTIAWIIPQSNLILHERYLWIYSDAWTQINSCNWLKRRDEWRCKRIHLQTCSWLIQTLQGMSFLIFHSYTLQKNWTINSRKKIIFTNHSSLI